MRLCKCQQRASNRNKMSLMASRLYLATFSGPICKTLTESKNPIPAVRFYAARKGTRERKEKRIVKKEVEAKPKFVPHNLRKQEKLLASRPTLKFNDSWKGLPVDDVYCMKYYQWTSYPFVEGVQCHKETHHPDMYNQPNAGLQVRVELNMQGEKITRFVDDFKRVVAVPHRFEHGEERSILAFGKTVEAQKEAAEAGAQLVGGVDLIKQIQSGDVSLLDFHYVIAHPDILPELVALRGLMKRKFPNPKNGTLTVDLKAVTEQFLYGISYSAKKDDAEKDFGLVEAVIGTLDMESEHLEANFKAFIQDLNSMKPRREGAFISRCLLLSPPSREKIRVNHEVYIASQDDKGKKAQEQEFDNDEEPGERVAL